MTIRCIGCSTEYLLNNAGGWRHFDRYSGPANAQLFRHTLTGSACFDCSARIYTPEGYKEAVLKQEVTKRLKE